MCREVTSHPEPFAFNAVLPVGHGISVLIYSFVSCLSMDYLDLLMILCLVDDEILEFFAVLY